MVPFAESFKPAQTNDVSQLQRRVAGREWCHLRPALEDSAVLSPQAIQPTATTVLGTDHSLKELHQALHCNSQLQGLEMQVLHLPSCSLNPLQHEFSAGQVHPAITDTSAAGPVSCTQPSHRSHAATSEER